MSEITRNEAIQIVEDIRTAISAGSVTNTMEAQVLDYCVKVLGGRIEEASQSGNIVNLADVVAFLAGTSSATTLRSLLSDITGKIPSEASGSNQLADKKFVTDLTTALQDAVNLINVNLGNGYVYAGIATPLGTPVSGKVFYLAKEAGTYTNFGGLVVTQGINILKYNGTAWSQEQLIGIDDVPTAGSNNLVKSGGVQNELALGAVYDVSAKNPTAGPNSDGKWESLSVLLSDANLNTIIPSTVRKGGMSIKFVQSSDNKYVQYRLIGQEFTTDVKAWAFFVDTIETESSEYIEAKTDNEGKLLWAIKADGTVFFGAGCPPQVQEYVIERLATKVDKVENKSLIDDDVAESVSCVENSEYLSIETDNENKILGGRKSDGSKFENMPVLMPAAEVKSDKHSEWLRVETDKDGRILAGRNKNGKTKEFVGLDVNELVFKIAYGNILNLSEEGLEKLKTDLGIEEQLPLPAYYFEDDYIINKVKSINDLWINTGANADLFAFFTDAHYYDNYKKTALLMEYLLKNTTIRKVVYGGDTAHNNNDDTVDDVTWENRVAKAIIPCSKYIPVRGNHDYYNNNKLYPYTAVRNNLFNLCNIEKIVIDERNVAVYYYFDEDFSKIRYIVLDTFDPYNPNYINRLEISDAQFAFVANALNTVPNGYSVVMAGHTSPQNGMMHDSGEYERADNLRKFIAAYQNRESVTINGNTYDFTGATSSIVMYIAGHSHEDMQNYIDNTLYVSVPSDARTSRPTAAMHTYHEYPQRVEESITEQCFDVCVFDRSNNVANFVRIGWGFNRRFNLNKIELQVGNTQQLTSVFTSVSQWLIHDSQGATYDSTLPRTSEWWSFTNDVATISDNGTVTALSAGECYAIAIAENGDKEFFYIKVQ